MPESPSNEFSPSPGVPPEGIGATPVPVPPPAAPRAGGFLAGLAALWTLTVRLLLLGMGISLGWLAGVLAAQLLPGPQRVEPPLQEVALRHGSRLVWKVRQFPQWWNEDLMPAAGTVNDPSPGALAADPLPAPAAPTPATAPSLEAVEREQIEAELSALGTELGALDNRVADLEVKLGEPVSDLPLESRVHRLNRSLAGEPAPSPAPSPAPPSSSPAAIAPQPGLSPLFQLARNRVTLPSALLFSPDQAILTPNAERILDTLLSDLARYPGATLIVGSHSGGPQTADVYQDLTFRQALAVQQYLASRLGEGYRWVPVGYGQTRPLVAATTPAEQQRNQRIEIAIVPQR